MDSTQQPARAHTPGPWHVALSPKYGEPFVTDSTGKLSITGSIGPRCIYAAKANARLIAAAPELLEALLNALPYVEDVLSDPVQLSCFKRGAVQKDAEAIRAAIAKAEGTK